MPTPQLMATNAARGMIAAFALAAVVYGGTALLVGHTSSDIAYFEHLAAAMLQGRLDIGETHGTHDLTPHAGKWFVPFPPLPALMLLPWVAIAGVERTNTVLFSVLVSAINVALVWRLLHELARRSEAPGAVGVRAWLTAMFALGQHWYMALEGSVWYLGQICTLSFVTLAAIDALRSAPPWRAALWLAIALWGRPNVLLLLPMLVLIWRSDAASWSALRPAMARAAIPLAASLLGLAAHNYARFQNPLDFGYTAQKIDTSLMGNLYGYGQFSPAHVPRNAWFLFAATPRVERGMRWPTPDDRGMSVLLVMPALLCMWRVRLARDLPRGFLAALLLGLVPLLLYYNSGWRQFGYRFLLDLSVPTIALLASAATRSFGVVWRMLIVVGVLVNLYGVVWWYTPLLRPPPPVPEEQW